MLFFFFDSFGALKLIVAGVRLPPSLGMFPLILAVLNRV